MDEISNKELCDEIRNRIKSGKFRFRKEPIRNIFLLFLMDAEVYTESDGKKMIEPKIMRKKLQDNLIGLI